MEREGRTRRVVDGDERERGKAGGEVVISFTTLKVTLCALTLCKDRNACRFWCDHGTSPTPGKLPLGLTCPLPFHPPTQILTYLTRESLPTHRNVFLRVTPKRPRIDRRSHPAPLLWSITSPLLAPPRTMCRQKPPNPSRPLPCSLRHTVITLVPPSESFLPSFGSDG